MHGPNYQNEFPKFPPLPGQHEPDADLVAQPVPAAPSPATPPREDKVAAEAIAECEREAKGKGKADSVKFSPYGPESGESPPKQGKGSGSAATEVELPSDSGRELGSGEAGA
jgi:hypothetical protein